MTLSRTDGPAARNDLRLWPGVVVVTLQWAAMLGIPVVAPEAGAFGVAAGFLGGLAVAVWWTFFSRAPRSERWGGLILMISALVATRPFLHGSIATGGMGMLFVILSIPPLSLAFVAWAVATSRLSPGVRRATMAGTILLACGAWTLVRTGGLTGAGDNDFAWRWSETPEERLLARVDTDPLPVAAEASAQDPAPAAVETTDERPLVRTHDEPPTPAAAPVQPRAGANWPGFRGPGRDSSIPGVRINTDWSASPPVELWRRPIGPGWSSFAVRDDLLYTQEQRGDDEIVACYRVNTGEPVWVHRDAARFWESNGGAGPRGTPALHGGRVYTLGGTGILNALDAHDGAVAWSRDAAKDTGAKLPGWGFSSSPLVVGDVVIVATSGILAAYDLATGDPRWSGPTRGGSYSSPHWLTIDGVPQILLMTGAGLISVAPPDGAVLWEHPWPGAPIVQPTRLAERDLLIATADMMGGVGTRRIAVAHGPGGWTAEERWTSRGLKPYFNDFVVHKGHAFGFDGFILACIDLADGKRAWKGGRYGNGQLVLLPDQNLLLVLSEKGELALVEAAPDGFTELARFPAITGKTWNHPVLVDDILLVRNGEEMAAFRLPLAND